MHIEKLKLENFKSYDCLEIQFNSHFNLIVGENNIGKSTIFEAMLLWQFAYQSLIQSRNKKKFLKASTNTYINFNDVSQLRVVDDLDLFKEITSSKKRLAITVWIKDGDEIFELKISLEKPGIKNAYLRLFNDEKFAEFERFAEFIKNKKCSLKGAIFIYQTKPVSSIGKNEPFYNNAQVQKKIAIGKSHDVLRNKILRTEKLGASVPVAEKFDWLEEKLECVLGKSYLIRSKNESKTNEEYVRLNTEEEGGKQIDISLMGSGFLQVLEIFSTLGYFDNTFDGLRLVLIDEPDSHVHSDIQHKLFDELKRHNENKEFQLFVISHNDRLVAKANDSELFFLNEVVKERGVLSALPLDNYSEVKASLSNVLYELEQVVDKPVLITEGKTDKTIIETAWRKLYPDQDLPFEIVSSGAHANANERTGNANTVQQTLNYVSNFYKQIIIGLFDNDSEGFNQYNGLKNTAFDILPRQDGVKIKGHLRNNAYAMCLPVPQIRSLFAQDDAKAESRCFVIEHYFSDSILDIHGLKGDPIFGSNVFKINGNRKNDFANACNTFPETEFTEFTVLFDRLQEILTFT